MKTITTIPGYCEHINIGQPRYPFFDVRRFEDKAKTENKHQAPFRHEFYAVALRHTGANTAVNGQPLQANLFFNSPYQIISWDVLPDWKGWYIMFGQEFLAINPAWKSFIVDFPFFRLDTSVPFDLPEAEVTLADMLFRYIFDAYHSAHDDKFSFIQSFTQLLLLLTKRHFGAAGFALEDKLQNRTADILLVSRFQTLVEACLMQEDATGKCRQAAYYAKALNIHPNHLNAMARRITGKTATAIIREQMIAVAKSLLRHTTLSAKEIAYRLHFTEPTHFSAFFKKAAGLTPQQYRSGPAL